MLKRLYTYGQNGRKSAIQQTVINWLIMVLPVLAAASIFSGYQKKQLNVLLTGILVVILVLVTIYLSLSRPRARMNQWAITAKQQIRQEYLEGIFKTDFVTAKKLTAETVINRDLQGIDRLDIFYSNVFPSFLASILSFLLLSLLSIWWNTWIWLLPIIVILLIGVSMMLLQKVGPKVNWEYMNGWLSMGHRFIDDLRGINTLVMDAADDRYQNSFNEKSEFFRQKTMDLLKYQLQSLFILNSLIFGALVITTLILWSSSVSIVHCLILWVLMAELLIAERQLGYFVHIIMSTKPAMTDIFNIIDQAPKNSEYDWNEKDLEKITEIKLEQVTFAYPGKQTLLDRVDLILKPGKLYGLVGHNGSGKSTIAQILRGQLKVTQGKVEPSKLTARIGYLSAQPYLFSGTIKENLTLGSNVKSDWRSYLHRLGLCDFINYLPDKFETLVGEGGKLLSPGQRQQIAFARLILMNKEAYIFDEVTSNIDEGNSKIILQAIQKLAEDKIVLMITHEWTIIEQIDSIYFLNDQHLVFGSVNELDQNNENFQKMMEAQKVMEAEL